MKVIYSCLVLLILSSFILKSDNYQVQCVSTDLEGYISLNIWNISKMLKYNEIDAQKDAIHCVLYSGITGGNCITQPSILNSTEEKNKFKAIEKAFFSKNGKWLQFIKSSQINNSEIKQGKIIYQVCISKTELRNYLISENIIKSFNNGF